MKKMLLASLILVPLSISAALGSGRQAKVQKGGDMEPLTRSSEWKKSREVLVEDAKADGSGNLDVSLREQGRKGSIKIRARDLPKVVDSYVGYKIENKDIVPITVSPDKRQVVFNVNANTNRDGSNTWLAVFELADGAVWDLGLNTGIPDWPGAVEWSPSGRKLAVVLVVGEAGPTVRVIDMVARQPLPTVDERRLLDLYPTRVKWSETDSELIIYGRAPDGRTNKEWILNVNTGELNEK